MIANSGGAAMDFDSLLPVFIAENRDNLVQFERDLMSLCEGEIEPDLVSSLFRTVHSIKAGAGMFNATPIAELSHIAESVLDLAREKAIEINNIYIH